LIGCITSVATACGPDFPTQLLDDREATLKAFPTNSFAYEASHLVPAISDRFKSVETEIYWYSDDRIDEAYRAQLAKAEADGLTSIQAKTLGLMREANSGDQAYDMGDRLPEEIRLYVAGAVDFRSGLLPAAATRFKAILGLAENERRARSVWAEFMIGEIAVKASDSAEASTAFVKTRQLAIDGAADPLGLAVASFGEEGKLHFELAKEAAGISPTTAETTAQYSQELAAAAKLYAQQAACGSNSGVQSLRMVAELALGAPDRLAALMSDQLLQRLLVAYALARIDDIAEPVGPAAGPSNYGPGRMGMRHAPILSTLVAAILESGVERPAGADRLAALAYRIGEYDLAEKMAAIGSSPLSEWVRAKIAVQKGDLAAAATAYSSAAKAFPALESSEAIEGSNAKRLKGEAGTLALARGDYIAALDSLFAVGDTYWGDVAYVAERVLTADELKLFVDTHAPAVDAATIKQRLETAGNPDAFVWAYAASPAFQLRKLLARRLVREGRYEEATTYFSNQRLIQIMGDNETDISFFGGEKKIVADPVIKRVTDYADALKVTASSWFPTRRASAFYRAATIARQSGMEMMGYEAAPDYSVVGGAFDFGYGRQDLGKPFVTELERQRFEASRASPDKRFHYRYIAVDEAVRAAGLVPARSQAFAAILCHASSWLIDRDPEIAATLYRRYLKEGPHVPWATHFGRSCPDPDFDSAARLRWRLPLWGIRHAVGRHRYTSLGMLLAAAALAVGLWRHRRGANAPSRI
jgi:hypothetical protein